MIASLQQIGATHRTALAEVAVREGGRYDPVAISRSRPMIRVLYTSRDTALPDAAAAGDALWIDRADVERATGWVWKPEGLCHGDTCVPLPRHAAPIVDGDRLDVAGFWRYAGWPVVHDEASQLWVLGEGAGHRASALASLDAPDFELPDLEGHPHRLSEYRGRRIFLATWASW
jgi:hypothetical protein